MLVESLAGNRVRAKRSEMRCFLLAIDQLDAILPEKENQMGQSDLGCIADTGKHRFAIKHFSQTDSICSSDQLVVEP